jgi:hypothetical protein
MYINVILDKLFEKRGELKGSAHKWFCPHKKNNLAQKHLQNLTKLEGK